MRYLAIDYGSRRTGLAICDPTETIVSPLAVVDSRKDLLERINEIIETDNVEAVVLGLPLNMDDTKGPQAQLVLEFAERLRKKLRVPVHLQDERLSSFAAEEKLSAAQYSKAKKKERLDAVAAAEILELFLEQKSSNDKTPD
ncbi:MAG: Holliday junction resolvase RuvX [Sedimentisphaerales bacterium]|jgi:putative Holliday junction resolvase